jgi:putative ABC transport system ATP-binding protein
MSDMVEADVATETAIVATQGLQKVYATAGHEVPALAGVDLAVPAGKFYAIMGASGSGKSTLLYLVGGLTQPTVGSVVVDGENLAAMSDRRRTLFRRERIGFVFQEFNLLPTLTALENVALPVLLKGQSVDVCRGRVDALLETVHLAERAGHRPDALSGGEQQRVAIARALLMDPAIILADEPTGNLDSKQSVEIWQLLREIAHTQGKTILMVTHEAQGAAYADRVVVLRDGKVVGDFAPRGVDDAGGVAQQYAELIG